MCLEGRAGGAADAGAGAWAVVVARLRVGIIGLTGIIGLSPPCALFDLAPVEPFDSPLHEIPFDTSKINELAP